MTHVIIRNLSYDETMIQRCVDEMLDSMGPQWITPGMRVLVKPNLLLPAPPERAIVTHPLICRAVVKYLLKKEAQVQVSDSPGIGLFHKLIRETGYQDALSDLDVDLKPFETSVEVDIGHPFGKIPIAKEAVEADRVINLAKLKTHAHMYLTLSIKNIFGCIVGDAQTGMAYARRCGSNAVRPPAGADLPDGGTGFHNFRRHPGFRGTGPRQKRYSARIGTGFRRCGRTRHRQNGLYDFRSRPQPTADPSLRPRNGDSAPMKSTSTATCKSSMIFTSRNCTH